MVARLNVKHPFAIPFLYHYARVLRHLMLSDPRTVALISQPGIMHNALRSMLAAIPSLRVLEAAGALSGWELVQRQPVDAVVIDANVPQAESLVLVKRLRLEAPHTRCIVLTSSHRSQLELRAEDVETLSIHECSLIDLQNAVLQAPPHDSP